MSYKTIYTYFTTNSQAKTTATMAAELAKHFEAYLIGCHIMYEPVIPVYDLHALEIIQPVIEQQRQIHRDNAKIFQEIFKTAAKKANIDHHWHTDDEFYFEYTNVIYDRLRAADLVVVGQTEIESIVSWQNIPARIALNSARPVLVIPAKLQDPMKANFKRVLLAWNGKNEAVRATFDALPFLKMAEEVKIVTVNPETDSQSSPECIVQTLKRHGVSVESARITNHEISTSDVLLSQSAEFDANLLVLGCYGHSRLQEIVFGGVTRDIFQTMTVPVLMSH